MAVRFYRELNNMSTADFLVESKKKKGKYHEVTRVISRRTRKRKISRFISSWSARVPWPELSSISGIRGAGATGAAGAGAPAAFIVRGHAGATGCPFS